MMNQRGLLVIGSAFLLLMVAAPSFGAIMLSYNNPPTSTGSLDAKVVTFINGATTSLEVAIYQLGLPNVVTALINARTRGVTVRVVVEATNWNASLDQLVAAGIPVVKDTDGGGGAGLMHNKYIIRDGNAVLTGSFNWTDAQLRADKNTVVVITGVGANQLAAAYRADFNQMFVEKRFGTQKTAVATTSVVVDSVPINVYFSPRGGVEQQVVSAINTYNYSLYFNCFTFTSSAIANAMAARDAAGKTVRGAFDAWQADGVYNQDEYLRSAGVEVKYDTYSGLLHDKNIAIDAGTVSDPIGIVGSYNFTVGGSTTNDENILIIHNSTVANSLKTNCAYVYTKRARF